MSCRSPWARAQVAWAKAARYLRRAATQVAGYIERRSVRRDGLGRRFGDDAEDVVGRGGGADVLHAVLVVGAEEENRARAALGRLAVDGRFHRALFDHDELLVGVAMRGVR